jgi:diguanylate cyclase (GGDEF)-like protein
VICRYGGDEFAVLMRSVDSARRKLLEQRCVKIQEALSHVKDGIPPVTLSIGIALEDRHTETNDVFADADTALYEVKQHGRNGYTFYTVAH